MQKLLLKSMVFMRILKILILTISLVYILSFSSVFMFSQDDKDKRKEELFFKMEGVPIKEDDTGLEKIDVSYVNGKPNGKLIQKYENGARTEGECILGVKNGLWIHYDVNGKRIWQESYKAGKKDGEFIKWSEKTGVAIFRCEYIDGRLNGKKLEWDESGKLIGECNFKDGRLHGRCVEWYSNGMISKEGYYSKGTGKSRTWYRNGRLSCEDELKNGLPFGISREWYESGKKRRVTVFDENGEVERLNHWYENGKKQIEIDYRKGHFKHKEWDANGKLFYDKKGNL